MFGWLRRKESLSDAEIRSRVATLVSLGCVLVMIRERRISEGQNYLLLECLSEWLEESDARMLALRVTDLMASLEKDFQWHYIDCAFAKGRQLPHELRVYVIRKCLTCAILGEWEGDDSNAGMRLIGNLMREIGLSARLSRSTIKESVEEARMYHALGRFAEPYQSNFPLLQNALSRTTLSSRISV